ncbi:TonB-dependent receptor [Altererythrobacter sp.]|uniref:TonB-dependent receptor n=1 Tax=Altererythrobacter sp. TaxID=1872480 RepID=UPI003D060479
MTAQRRAQSVNDVPYNISAVSAEALEKANISDFAKLARAVPGLVFTESGPRDSGLNSGLIMRGLNVEGSGSSDLLSIAAPTVSTYVGETPMFVNLHLKDIERVEILRGPQGTLYGSGSLGGTIRYIPQKPVMGEFSVEISSRIGHTQRSSGVNTDTYGIVNVPFGNNLALRVVGGYVENKGFVDVHGLATFNDQGHVLDKDGVDRVAQGDFAGQTCLGFDSSSYCTGWDIGGLNFVNGGVGQKYQPMFHSKKNVNRNTITHVRAELAWEPTDDLRAQITYQHQKDFVGGRQVVNPWNDYAGEWAYNAHVLETLERKVDLYALDLEADLGFASLSGSVSHYSNDANFISDQSGLYVNNFFHASAYYANMPMDVIWGDYSQRDKGTSAELRLASNGDGPFEYLLGAFWLRQKTAANQNDMIPGVYEIVTDYLQRTWGSSSTVSPPDPSLGFGPNLGFVQHVRPKYTDKAIFGEVTYHLTDDWQVTGGARVFDQTFEVQNDLFLLACGAFCDSSDPDRPVPPEFEGTGYQVTHSKQNFKDQIFKVNTSYSFAPSQMVYATWSQGFRHGGANAIVEQYGDDPATEGAYKSDRATNYEVGIKGSTAGRWLDYSLALFNIEWKDMQFFTLAQGSGVPVVLNANKAHTRGIEAEGSFYLTDNFTARLGMTYIDAKLTKDTILPQLVAYAGDKLPGVPEFSWNLGAEYTRPLSNSLDFGLLFNMAHVGKVQTDFNPDAPNYTVSKAYTIADMSARLSAERWELSLFVDNLFNKRALTNARSPNSWNGAPYTPDNIPWSEHSQNGYYLFANVNRPRTFGLSVKYRYR